MVNICENHIDFNIWSAHHELLEHARFAPKPLLDEDVLRRFRRLRLLLRRRLRLRVLDFSRACFNLSNVKNLYQRMVADLSHRNLVASLTCNKPDGGGSLRHDASVATMGNMKS